jgi:hypothetical protein
MTPSLRCPACFWSGEVDDLDAHEILPARSETSSPQYFCPACGRHLVHRASERVLAAVLPVV